MLADSIPRYAEPVFEDDELIPSHVMRQCTHSGACIRLIEVLGGDTFDATSDESWDKFAGRACCVDCLEWCS